MVSPGTFVLHDAVRPACPMAVTSSRSPSGSTRRDSRWMPWRSTWSSSPGPGSRCRRISHCPELLADADRCCFHPAAADRTAPPDPAVGAGHLPGRSRTCPGSPWWCWPTAKASSTTNQPVDTTGLPNPDLRLHQVRADRHTQPGGRAQPSRPSRTCRGSAMPVRLTWPTPSWRSSCCPGWQSCWPTACRSPVCSTRRAWSAWKATGATCRRRS